MFRILDFFARLYIVLRLFRPNKDKLLKVLVWGLVLILIGALISLIGGQIDLFAHTNNLVPPGTDTFQRHALLYLGMIVLAILLIPPFMHNLSILLGRGKKLNRALLEEAVPMEEAQVILFWFGIITLIAVVLDIFGHTLWGVEPGAASLYVFTHLFQGIGLIPLYGGFCFNRIIQREVGKLLFRKEWVFYFSRWLAWVLINMLFHHFNPIESLLQTPHGWATGIFKGTSIPLTDIADESVVWGMLSYIWTGNIVLTFFELLTQPRFKQGSWVLVVDFVILALPATYANRPILLVVNGIAGIFAALLIKRYPLYRIPKTSHLFIHAIGLPIIMYTVNTIYLGFTETLWWPPYVNIGGPVLMVMVGTAVAFTFRSMFHLKEDMEHYLE